MIATEDEVALNSWLEYAGGRERTRSFVDDWTPGADQVATASQTPSGGSLHNESSRRDALPSAAKWFIE